MGDDDDVQPPEPRLVIPARGLVLLVGASGAGKTTFASRHFLSTEVLSSDGFRAMVGDDASDQSATAAAFDLLARVLALRLRRGRLSVVDATNVNPGDRRGWLRLATVARRPTVAVVLDLPEAVCRERNARREGRVVDDAVIRRQLDAVRRTLADPGRLLAEGYAAVHVLDDAASVDRVVLVREDGMARPAAGGAASGPDGRQLDVSPRRRAPRDRRA